MAPRAAVAALRATSHGTGLDWAATTSTLHFTAPSTPSTAPTAGKARKPSWFFPRFKPLNLSSPATNSSNQGCGLDRSGISETCEDYGPACEDGIDGINGVDGSRLELRLGGENFSSEIFLN
ncbi:unnamed protein product [Prunus armeniaca]